MHTYFQSIWMATNAVARTNDIAVLALTPSFIYRLVNIAKDIIPVANPINLPGHNVPSKYVTISLVAMINEYEIGLEKIHATRNGCLANHSHLNWPLV